MALKDRSLTRDQLYAWDQWVVWYLGGRPWPASFLIAGILFASYWVFAWGSGVYSEADTTELLDELDTPALLFGLGPYEWGALVLSLLGGYAGTVASYNLVSQQKESSDAAAMLGFDKDELRSQWDKHNRENRPTGRLVCVIGYIFGFVGIVPAAPGVMELLGFQGRYESLPPASMQIAAVWFFIVGPLIFSLICKAVYLAVAESRFWSQFRRQAAPPDIFDLTKLRPVTRAAMRGSFTWIIGATIGSLFFLSDEIDRGVSLPFFMGIGLVAVSNLIVPLVGWHRVLLVEKERQLKDVRIVIDRCWSRLKAASDDDVALSKLGGLLALEARIRDAREWPIDFSTIGKLILYLAIPLISWIGGALMERAVDAAIG